MEVGGFFEDGYCFYVCLVRICGGVSVNEGRRRRGGGSGGSLDGEVTVSGLHHQYVLKFQSSTPLGACTWHPTLLDLSLPRSSFAYRPLREFLFLDTQRKGHHQYLYPVTTPLIVKGVEQHP